MTEEILNAINAGDIKALSRCISMVENESEGASDLLESLKYAGQTPVIGITGPPGAGKSTLINSLIDKLTTADKKNRCYLHRPHVTFQFWFLAGG